MFFSWLKKRRRARLLVMPCPAAWPGFLERLVHFHWLTEEERSRLCDLTRIFIAERNFEGCQGLEITDEIRVTVAALACLLVLGWRDFIFENVPSILVYPGAYVATEQHNVGGVVMEKESDRLGEAHYRGPLILSWDEVVFDALHPEQGSNLVFHEFAHQLDMRNGAANLPRSLRQRWQTIMAGEYERLCRAAKRGRPTLFDSYGATNHAEFFAVVTECFFTVPKDMRVEHPDLYELFREYYQQDPAEW
jgi:Mlc titration factor MtfA (ptsG expression regulator)